MSRRNVWFLSVLAVIGFCGGIIQQLALHSDALLLQSGLPYGFVALAVIFAWYKRDANERGYRRTVWLNVMVVALAIIALPYYLFRSRGFSRGLIATLKFLAMMATYTVLQIAGNCAVYLLHTRT